MEVTILVCVWRCPHCLRERETRQTMHPENTRVEMRVPQMCLCEESERFDVVSCNVQSP